VRQTSVYFFQVYADRTPLYYRKQSAEEGNSQNPVQAYLASKTLAERAAWEFVETNKPVWEIATINPPLVFGPIIHQVGQFVWDNL
jgi:nucleoside-diphosphate-sugar epimerase